MKNKLTIRNAEPKDISTLKKLIIGLAEHERRPQDVTGTEEEMCRWLFDRKIATALLAEANGKAVGYAIYYPVYGSYSARGRIHLEDIFIDPKERGKGYGTELLTHICQKVTEEGYSALEWSALDFNTESIDWYLRLGAEPEKGRTYFDFPAEKVRELMSTSKN